MHIQRMFFVTTVMRPLHLEKLCSHEFDGKSCISPSISVTASIPYLTCQYRGGRYTIEAMATLLHYLPFIIFYVGGYQTGVRYWQQPWNANFSRRMNFSNFILVACFHISSYYQYIRLWGFRNSPLLYLLVMKQPLNPNVCWKFIGVYYQRTFVYLLRYLN